MKGDFPGCLVVKKLPASAGGAGSTPWSARSPGEGNAACSSLLAAKSHQRSLAGCSPRGRKESDTTERLNNNNLNEKTLNKSLIFQAGRILMKPNQPD